jgi:hypothetical protein
MPPYDVELHPLSADLPALTGRIDFETYLFNEPAHLLTQPGSSAFCFLLISPDHVIKARFTLFIQQNQGLSPFRAPFGSIEFAANLGVAHLDFFLDQIEEFGREKQLQSIRITGYPFSYAPEASQTLSQRLLYRGYRIINSELSYHLSVSTKPFESLLQESERRRLRKCEKAGFQFAEEKQPDLEKVYQYVAACRLRRGFPVSLSQQAFVALFHQFPDVYRVFTVTDGNNVVALTVTVKINDRILYNFYPADAVGYQTYSPTVLLTKGLYAHCQEKCFAMLDLGISTDQGAANYGLIRFKQNLGAIASLKLSFEKELRP